MALGPWTLYQETDCILDKLGVCVCVYIYISYKSLFKMTSTYNVGIGKYTIDT